MDTNLGPQGLNFYDQGTPSGMNNMFEAFLGPMPRSQSINPYEKRNTAVFNMPEAYLGRNLFLRDTVLDWMLTADQRWQTERILPWVITDEIHVQWQQWETNAHFMGITPHQAPSRRVSQKHNIRRATLVRRGIMIEFEHDFVRTAMGQMSFMKGLGQIARSIQETANIEVIRALVNGYRYQQKFMSEAGFFKKGDLMAALERDRDNFALVQKDQQGLEKWDAHSRKEQKIWRGTSNAIIMGEEVSLYTELVGPERILYKNAGPLGPARINNTPLEKYSASGDTQGNLERIEAVRAVRDTQVFVARTYALDGVGKADVLTRTRAIGEYNYMLDECPTSVPYTSDSMDISIKDEDRDEFACITADMGIEHCGIWDTTTGRVNRAIVGPPDAYGVAMANQSSLEQRDYLRNFLVRPTGNGTFKPIEYIGDLAEEYLSDEAVERAGHSLMRAAFNKNEANMREAEQILSQGVVMLPAPEDQDEQPGLNGDLTILRNAINGMKGNGIIGVPRDAFANDLDMFNNFFSDNRVPIVYNGPMDYTNQRRALADAEAQLAAADDANRAARQAAVDAAKRALRGDGQREAFGENTPLIAANMRLFNALKAPLPEEHHADIDRIIAQNDVDAETKAHQIREHIENLASQQLPGFEFQNKPAVKKWFKKRFDAYQKHVAENVASSVQTSQKSTQPSQKMGWAKPGQQLPTGWRYVHEASQHEQPIDSGSGNFPNTILGISSFLTQHHAQLSQQRARQQGTQTRGAQQGRRGIGAFASIGQLDDSVVDSVYQKHHDDAPGAAQLEGGVLERFRNLDKRLRAISVSTTSRLHKLFSMLYLFHPFTKQTFKLFRRQDVRLPFGFIFARPQGTYTTHTILKCQDNGGTGNTFFGKGDMQMGHDSLRKIGIAHYTAYMAAVITQPRNLYIQHDAMSAKYHGGFGIRFFTPQSYISFVRSADLAPRDSIITFIIPYEERDIPLVFDISGRFYTQMKLGLLDEHQGSELAFSTALMYNQMYQFYAPMTQQRALDDPDHLRGRKHVNRIVWRGCQYNKNPVTGLFDKYRANHGHKGDAVYPGSCQVFNGKAKYLDPKRILPSSGN